jgi:UDP-GlcNAc:undecaprenyl-phosphate GlcNAc-1-phosphate transferase
MALSWMLLTFGVFVIISIVFNYLFLRWTRTLGTKDLAPAEELRWSAAYKPAIGGISFYIIFLISYAVYLFFHNPDLRTQDEMFHLGILVTVTIGFFTGLADDAFNTVPWLKLVAQIICGIILLLFDIKIEFFESYIPDALLTIFWTVAVMNAINMLDNMDGITSIVSIFILITAGIIADSVFVNNLFFTFICGGAVAALTGFLFFNWHPSKIFMGDTGSQMLGALLASVGILFFWNNAFVDAAHSWYSKVVVVTTTFIIPIADSLTVTANRILSKKSPFVGGKDHTTHHLSYAGLNDKQVAWVMIIISTISLAFIVLLKRTDQAERNIIFSILFIYCLSVIGFLYSTTRWKKSRSVYLSKQSNPTSIK